jgi:predicted dehydrogenase
MIDASRREFLIQSAGALSAMAILPDLAALAGPRGVEGLRLGLIGCGRQGRAILGELQKIEGVQVSAVCDNDEARRNGAMRRAGEGAQAYADHRQLLEKAKDLAGVIVATPTHLHKDIVVDALAAGRHVYVEAPIAHTPADCRAIAQAAAKAGKLVCACGLEGRSNPIYKLARSFFRSDAVRDLIALEACQFQKTSWRFPSSDASRDREINWRLDPEVSLGLAGEWGVQAIDVFAWYTDQWPGSVRGSGAVRLHQDGRKVPDTVQIEGAYNEGVRMQYAASLANSYGGRAEVLRGSNASMKLAWTHGWMFKEADAPTQGWEVYANKQQFHNDEGITLIADATKLASQGKLKDGVGLPYPSLYYALADFVRSVSEGKPAACDAAAGARSTIVAIAAAESIVKNQAVAITPEMMKLEG